MRAAATKAMKSVRSVKSDLELRRSKMHMAMRMAREAKRKHDQNLKSSKFAGGGKNGAGFGSTVTRETDPSLRKVASTPEDPRG